MSTSPVFGCSNDEANQQPVDVVTISRATLERLHTHLNAVYTRFPNRNLRQSILIIQHLLKATP